jgi:RNA polymerase sigma factor (sigma-70 family)
VDDFQQGLVELLPRMRRLARMFAGDRADADDLVQIVVERALGRKDQWRAGTRLDSWVFRIMKNAWIDEARSRQRAGRVFTGEDEGRHVADAAAPAMETRLAAAEVERALMALPQDQRMAVALVLIDGLSYREAADVLDVPMGTLTSRLVRGRMALMASLDGEQDAQ